MAARNPDTVDERSTWPRLALKAYEPLDSLRNAPKYRSRLTEISINGPGLVELRLAGEGYVPLSKSDAGFCTRKWFQELCSFFAAAHGVNWASDLPMLACRTPDGDRLMAIEGPNVESGMASSIRVKRIKNVEYENFGLDQKSAALLSQAMSDGKNIFLSGGTGSGKTTLFNRMCKDIPVHHRVITAEDTRELEIHNRNRVHFIVSRTEAMTRIRYNEITDTVLRLNPDRYIFGELSIQNAFAMLQALDTGHEGAGTTGHANSAYDFMRGMRRRVALGGGNVGGEIDDILDFIADNVHLIVQVKHMPTAQDTERRLVTEMEAPKTLLSRRKRADLVDHIRHDDRVIDLGRAREVLLAANAGEALSPGQNDLLKSLALLGFFQAPGSRRSPVNHNGAPDPSAMRAGDKDLLSPEERFLTGAAERGRTLATPAGGQPLRFEGAGELVAQVASTAAS